MDHTHPSLYRRLQDISFQPGGSLLILTKIYQDHLRVDDNQHNQESLILAIGSHSSKCKQKLRKLSVSKKNYQEENTLARREWRVSSAISISGRAPEHRNCDLIFEVIWLQCDIFLLWWCYVDIMNWSAVATCSLSEWIVELIRHRTNDSEILKLLHILIL